MVSILSRPLATMASGVCAAAYSSHSAIISASRSSGRGAHSSSRSARSLRARSSPARWSVAGTSPEIASPRSWTMQILISLRRSIPSRVSPSRMAKRHSRQLCSAVLSCRPCGVWPLRSVSLSWLAASRNVRIAEIRPGSGVMEPPRQSVSGCGARASVLRSLPPGPDRDWSCRGRRQPRP
jgi:hypothetical protein